MKVGLKNLIDHQFTQGRHPELMLKKLQELKQGTKDIDDFITEFENFKSLVKISDDHAIKILQQNVQWDLMEKFITIYGPPASYWSLMSTLINVDHADQYLKMIKCPSFTSFHPCLPIAQMSTHQLP